MAHVIVEITHSTPLDPTSELQVPGQLTSCLARRNIRWLRTLRSRDRQRTLFELEAADAELVRESYRIAGIPFDRIWTADIEVSELLEAPSF